MARDGYRIFDSDTHVGPDAAILEPYLSAADRERLARWAPYRATGRSGRVTHTKGERHYRRKLGAAMPDAASAGYMAGFTGVARERQPSLRVDADPAARIADMDYEGVDANLTLPSGWFGTWTAGDDAALRPGRTGHLGQSMAAAFGGASLVRHAQHGVPDRQRRHGPLPELAHRDLGSRAWLAAFLDQAARRACRDDQSRLARAATPPDRLRDERPLFPEHRDPRRRAVDQRGRRSAPR